MSSEILIVDDELPARIKIRALLDRIAHDFIIHEADSGKQALLILNSEVIDIVILDIQMPKMTGLELVQKFDSNKGSRKLPPIIFSTAFDDYAVKAFEVNAFDYLLKPYDFERFHKAIHKVINSTIQDSRQSSRIRSLMRNFEDKTEHSESIWVSKGSKMLQVKFNEVIFLEADDNYVFLNLGEQRHIVRKSLSGFLKILDPKVFVRVHRSYIANRTAITELTPKSHGDMFAHFKNGAKIPVSRKYKQLLLNS